jgi:hypothetical protein
MRKNPTIYDCPLSSIDESIKDWETAHYEDIGNSHYCSNPSCQDIYDTLCEIKKIRETSRKTHTFKIWNLLAVKIKDDYRQYILVDMKSDVRMGDTVILLDELGEYDDVVYEVLNTDIISKSELGINLVLTNIILL